MISNSTEMKLLFEVFHPKHFHIFRHIAGELRHRGHEVRIIARDKDVVFRLLHEHGIDFDVYGLHGRSMLGKFTALPGILRNYASILRDFQPDLIFSKGSPYAAIMSKPFRVRTIVFPDSEVVVTNRITLPLASLVITPHNYSVDHGAKHRRIHGFLEDCYLHPDRYSPSPDILGRLGVQPGERYALLRFVGWFANHDVGHAGFDDRFKLELVERLAEHMRVFVSTEANPPQVLLPYRLDIPASRIHDVLYYASLYVGDSQSMATEAALLGTPSIRSNSFVGPHDMSNFKVLEHELGMMFNFARADEALDRALDLARDVRAKQESSQKRNQYYRTHEDVNLQIFDYLEQFEPRLRSSANHVGNVEPAIDV
jgi:uncharacterized protein